MLVFYAILHVTLDPFDVILELPGLLFVSFWHVFSELLAISVLFENRAPVRAGAQKSGSRDVWNCRKMEQK